MKSSWKGIVLAGGYGTRLHPVTHGTSKQLLPIYNKPMIYYPISVLMLSGIRDILIITSAEYIKNYQMLLGDGSNFGIHLEYAIQDKPEGLAQAFIIGEEFIKKNNVALVLGDNFFYGQNFSTHLQHAVNRKVGATIFGHYVSEPERFGIVEIDKNLKIVSIEEKPKKPKSNYAVTGLYFYDNDVCEISKSISKSSRGELEITDVNNEYLKRNELNLELLGRGFAWHDMGTHESFLKTSQFVYTIEEQQGLKIACLEEIALNQKWLSKLKVIERTKSIADTDYGKYLISLINEYES